MNPHYPLGRSAITSVFICVHLWFQHFEIKGGLLS